MKLLSIISLVLTIAVSSYAGEAMLRIKCDAESESAQVYINGDLKGECPLDLMLEPGPCTVEAVKKVGAEHERRWSQNLTLGDGTIKRIVVTLSKPQLTTEAARAREIAIIEQKKKASEKMRLLKIAVYEKTKKDAQGGNVASMFTLSRQYARGEGVKQNPEFAYEWEIKAKAAKEIADAQKDLKSAQAGKISAMETLVKRYADGRGLEQSESLSKEWSKKVVLAKESNREKAIQDEATRKQRAIAVEAKRKRTEIKAEIDSLQWFSNLKYVYKESDEIDKDWDPFSPGIFYFSTSGPTATVLDLTVAPTLTTEKQKLMKELDAHASTWANPDSMIAKAHKNRLVDRGNEIAVR